MNLRWIMLTVKRVMDIILSLVALIALSPLIGIIGLAIRASLGSPVIFTQQRPGQNGKPFTILKFRTMNNPAGNVITLAHDSDRLTPFGRFLRSTSLDELPELINVLRGEMSLVGPRPLLMQYLDRYTPEQMRRHEVRPGITGWAQVNGRNAISWEEKFTLDVWYVDHMNLWLDIRILFMTIWKSIRREGISHPGEATMQEFMGTPSSPEAQ